ncbi:MULTISPECIES: ATP-binding protein [Acidithiobacillus]|uniref:ATP-binding protein n=1 Tax=Acidithiobacillus TaxID=119977 RepID=UPI001112282A|nr:MULTISPECIES: ATP-binding protein [Acidithiobacillus]
MQSPLVIITIGVTASGKSTWAQQMQKKYSTLDMAIIQTPETPDRNQTQWLNTVKAALHHSVIILDGKNLDDAQFCRDLQTLNALGVKEVVIQYFAPESLFVLLSRNKGVGGEQIRHELQTIQSQAHYLNLLDAEGYTSD